MPLRAALSPVNTTYIIARLDGVVKDCRWVRDGTQVFGDMIAPDQVFMGIGVATSEPSRGPLICIAPLYVIKGTRPLSPLLAINGEIVKSFAHHAFEGTKAYPI